MRDRTQNRSDCVQGFWKNVPELLEPRTEIIMTLQGLQDLIKLDVDGIIDDFIESEVLKKHEKKAIYKIGEIYKFYQRDRLNVECVGGGP